MLDERLRYGSIVSIYIDDKRKFVIKLGERGILGTDKGFVKHDDIVGKKYGDYVLTSQGYKAFLLRPLPQDYQYGIKRITQIIYPKDASLMIYLSGISCGSRVLEAGVGTGFLTINLARSVCTNGRVYGYDIVPEHLEVAKENLEKTGYIDRVELKLQDVRKGVKLSDIDAVFYDLPDPWNAIDTAYTVLKPSSPILIYVPTVNQVEKTVISLREHGGFIDIHVYETFVREYEVSPGATRPKTTMIGHTGYIIFARKVLL
ncbi:MAG: tRNA (adenine-N1)-methyltransferase [Thermoprotei archaeon]